MKTTGCLGVILVAILPFLAWCTHIYSCFTKDQWGFLIAGILAFPIGIIHGVGIWLGLW